MDQKTYLCLSAKTVFAITMPLLLPRHLLIPISAHRGYITQNPSSPPSGAPRVYAHTCILPSGWQHRRPSSLLSTLMSTTAIQNSITAGYFGQWPCRTYKQNKPHIQCSIHSYIHVSSQNTYLLSSFSRVKWLLQMTVQLE